MELEAVWAAALGTAAPPIGLLLPYGGSMKKLYTTDPHPCEGRRTNDPHPCEGRRTNYAHPYEGRWTNEENIYFIGI